MSGNFCSPKLITILSGMLLVAGNAFAGPPSQLPLLTRDASGPVPNLVFTLDDSGSMRWASMGSVSFAQTHLIDATGGSTVLCGWTCQSIGYVPEESNDTEYTRWQTVSTRDGDLTSGRWRSAQINTIYYNPQVLYSPWANGDGTNMPSVDPAAAPLDPVDTASPTANLMGIQTIANTICFDHETIVFESQCQDIAAEEFAPATYYFFNGGEKYDPTNYTRIRIADGTTFLTGEARTDCPADIVDPSIRICSQAEEYQNFANWFSYYRNRYLMAIGATSLAFAPLGDSMRVGYGRIANFTDTDIDGVNHQTLERGVRKFAGVDRTAFFDWLKYHASNGP